MIEVLNRTPKDLESQIKPRCASRAQVEELYDARDKFVSGLQTKGSIGMVDLAQLDRLGRFRVAAEFFPICSPDVQEALLADAHGHVRSAALISQMQKAAKCSS